MILYDRAIFLTSDEFKTKIGTNVNIQAIIEKPQIHFIARCRSSEDEQIARLSCIKQTSNPLKSPAGTELFDVRRFFKADSPARQFEQGQQKGGNYFCDCGCHASMTDDLAYAQSCHLYSLQERVNAIMKPGTVSRQNTVQGMTKPLACLSRAQLEKKLGARGICDMTGKDLEHLLAEKMHGIQ